MIEVNENSLANTPATQAVHEGSISITCSGKTDAGQIFSKSA